MIRRSMAVAWAESIPSNWESDNVQLGILRRLSGNPEGRLRTDGFAKTDLPVPWFGKKRLRLLFG